MNRSFVALTVSIMLAATAGSGLALKPGSKAKPAPCPGRFVLDASQLPLVASETAGAMDQFEVAGRKVTVTLGGSCSVQRPLQRTRNGWRFQAHWGSCGGLSNARLSVTIGAGCQFTGRLRAKRQPGKTFTAHLSECGDRVVDPGLNEQCDPPGPGCDGHCRLASPVTPSCADSGKPTYVSTWEAIQKTIFVRHDCANDVCHGSTAQAGLDLRPAGAYGHLVGVPSSEVRLARVEPRDERRSYLWLKVLAKTDPASLPAYLPAGVQILLSPMPNNATTLSKDEVDALRLWIAGGASESDRVAGTADLLGVCLEPRTTPSTTSTTVPPSTSTTTTTSTTTPPGASTTTTLPQDCNGGGGTTYASTWEAIQRTIFARHDCANVICHGGSSPQAGLDLQPAVAYRNIVEVQSNEVPSLTLVEPGEERRSYLWLKLLAKTDPASLPNYLPPGVDVIGSPMPNNDTVLSKDELEALRLWIYATAPETGTVPGTESLLNACLPPPEPIKAIPLDPPAADQGVQFVLPPWTLPAHSQHELCFATYYDFTDKVPAAFKHGGNFVWNAQTLRQDPQSHHLLLYLFRGSVDQIHDPSFGTWRCNGGEQAGRVCEPTDLASCGSGICTSEAQESFGCFLYGPPVGSGFVNTVTIGGAQKAQSDLDFAPGVWSEIPLKGILFWNPHAFNLTDQDTTMHGWLNYYYTSDQRYLVHPIFDASHIFAAAGIPPYSTGTVCYDYTFNDFTSRQQAYLFSLSSHTHRHGQHFWVTDPQHGDQLLYENFVYDDPPNKSFDPPLVFNRGDRLHYCALFNNGVARDGSPDTDLVTRASRVPRNAPEFSFCTPTACVAGKMSPPAACRTNRDCDSVPGALDGACDACPITGGESTENEMFILIGQYFVK